MTCKLITRIDDIIVSESEPAEYCGADLEQKLNNPTVTVGNTSTTWDCSDK
jgi:hypothetical protein